MRHGNQSVQFLKGLLNIFSDQYQARVRAEVIGQFLVVKAAHADFIFKANSILYLSNLCKNENNEIFNNKSHLHSCF